MKKLFLLLIAISLTVVITACGDDDNESENTQEDANEQELEVTDEELAEEDQVVLTVNDEDILGNLYNPLYYQTKQQMYQYGMDISDLESVKEQTYNQLIAQELIRQDAIGNGLEVSEDEVNETMDELKEDEEQFEAYLELYDLTEDAFKDQIKFNLLVDKYITNEIKIDEVTDEEVQETYDQLKEQNEDIMEFEEAEEIIRQQLTQQKQSEQLQAKVDELEETAEIEKTL